MVSIGQTGSLGSEWELQNSRRNRLERVYGQQIDLYSNLTMQGVNSDAVLDKIEMVIEGFDSHSEPASLLSWDDSVYNVQNPDDRVFIDSEQKYFTNVDLDAGKYVVMDEQAFTEELGMDWSDGKPYDVFDKTLNNIDFYDFVFSGTSDGKQDNYVVNLRDFDNAKWGVGNYTIREVNKDLLSYDNLGTDTESALARDTLDIITRTMPQWTNNRIQNMLSNMEIGSRDYNQKFIDVATQLMDQEGYLQGNEIEDPGQKYLDEQNSTSYKPLIKPSNGSTTVSTKDSDGITWSSDAGVVGGSAQAIVGDYLVTKTQGTKPVYYTATSKSGQIVKFSSAELNGQSLSAYLKGLEQPPVEKEKPIYVPPRLKM